MILFIHRINYKMYYIIFLWLTTSLTSLGQISRIGNPEIINFTKTMYAGGTQNWDMATGKNNELLVANNEGVLVFNGHSWQKLLLPNKTIVRSVAYDQARQRIYAGGQDEFGYFEANKKGNMIFTSLVNDIPDAYRLLEDVWDIVILQDEMYFRSLNRLFIYTNGKWNVREYKDRVFSLSVLEDRLVYQIQGEGLYMLQNGQPSFLAGSEILANIPVVSVIAISAGKWFIFSEKEGVFVFENGKISPVNSPLSTYLKKNLVHSASKISEDYIAAGTYLNGLVIFDTKGGFKYLLDKTDGLLNNTVSSVFSDAHGQVWAGTYNGISCIKLHSPYSVFTPDVSLSGAVYDVEIYDNKIYCGTENGLYFASIQTAGGYAEQSGFQLVSGSEGQVWGLDKVHGDLIMSHNDGAFSVKGNKVYKISKTKGAWKFIEWNTSGSAIGGFYDGLYYFEKINGQWVQKEKVSNFQESSRIFVKKDNDIWVAHPYRGLFKICISGNAQNAKITSFGMAEGLPTKYRNHVFLLHDQVLVAAEKGIYRYDETKNSFSRLQIFDSHFDNNTEFKRLFSHGEYVWFVTDKEMGYLRLRDNILVIDSDKKVLPGITQKLVAGFENIFPMDEGHALIMTNNGVLYYRPMEEKKYSLNAYISSVRSLKDDSIVYNDNTICQNEGDGKTCFFGKFNNTYNAFEFTFSSGSLESPVYYRYKLKTAGEEWSDWSSRNYKEYNNIPYGKHFLILQSKDIHGNESPEVQYTFYIRPPWYRSAWAWMLYMLIIAASLWYARKLTVKKFETKTIQLEAEIKESDAKVEQLINEKLEAEVMYKTKELGLSTMHLMQKNETISKLRQELEKIKNMSNDFKIRQEIKSLISILSDDERLDDEWDSFAQNFDQIHNDFLKRIKVIHPGLTPKDLKLCAYLKMNLTSKELAPLLNISVRGVEISRYRLRKKLGIPNEANLNDYMMNL